MTEFAPGTPNTAVAASEAIRAQAYVDRLHTEALVVDAERDSFIKQDAIEARLLSPEMVELNNAAEIAIYGTRGRTEGYVNADGTPLKTPIKGKIDEIRENPRYGTKQADRDTAANKYKADTEALVEEGFELCQANLIMDKRAEYADNLETERRSQLGQFGKQLGKHESTIAKLVSQYQMNGETEERAKILAQNRLAGLKGVDALPKQPTEADKKKVDDELKEKVRTEGIFTPEDFDRVAGTDPTLVKPADSPEKIAEKEKDINDLESLTAAAAKARNEYAKLSAGRARRTLGFGKKYSKDAVAKARAEFEKTRRSLTQHEVDMALKAGVSEEDLSKHADLFALSDAEKLTDELYDERLVATGRFQENSTTGRLEAVESKNAAGRMANKFYRWWGKQADSKLLSKATFKKSAAMATAGVIVGVPAALAGSVLLGPIAGGALGAFAAGKIAKGVMANHVARNSKGEWHVNKLHNMLEDSIDSGNASRIGDIVDAQTGNEVHGNRRRVIASMAAAAIGGTLGAVGAEHLFGLGGGDQEATTGGTNAGGSGLTPEDSSNFPNLTQHPEGNNGGTNADGSNSTNHGGHSNNHAPKHETKDDTAKLAGNGDSVWNEVSKYMDQHGYDGSSNADVKEVTQAVLKEKGINWDQAHALQEGYSFPIPREALDALDKKS